MIRLAPRSRTWRAGIASVLDSCASALLGAGAMASVLGGSFGTAAVIALGWLVLVALRASLAVAEEL